MTPLSAETKLAPKILISIPRNPLLYYPFVSFLNVLVTHSKTTPKAVKEPKSINDFHGIMKHFV